MDPEQTHKGELKDRFENFKLVIPLYKYLPTAAVISSLFLGGYIGHEYAQEKMPEAIPSEVNVANTHSDNKLTNIDCAEVHPMDIYITFDHECLFSKSEQEYIFAKPTNEIIVYEHSQCSSFGGVLNRYNPAVEQYEFISNVYIDTSSQNVQKPCNLRVVGRSDSKYYFAEVWGNHDIFVINTAQQVPVLAPLQVGFLHPAVSGDTVLPEDLVLVTDFQQSKLMVLHLQTGETHTIYEGSDSFSVQEGWKNWVYIKSFTNEQIELEVLPKREESITVPLL